MNGALMIDVTTQESYYINNGHAYFMKNDKLYNHVNHIDSRYEPPFFSFSRIFDNGYMLNLFEYGLPGQLQLPKLDLDYIIVAIEKIDYKIKEIRKHYPNAIIISTVKEYNPAGGHPLNSWKDILINTCNDSDYATVTYHTLTDFNNFQKKINKPLQYLPVAIDVDFLYTTYHRIEREKSILCYFAPTHMDRGTIESLEFSKHLAKKYDMKLVIPPYPVPFRVENRIPFSKFIKYMSESMMCVNLDKWYMLGQQPLQCAAFGTLHIGGISEGSKQLWGKLATNDITILENEVKRIISNSDYHFSYLVTAYNALEKTHGLQAVRNRLIGLTNE